MQAYSTDACLGMHNVFVFSRKPVQTSFDGDRKGQSAYEYGSGDTTDCLSYCEVSSVLAQCMCT